MKSKLTSVMILVLVVVTGFLAHEVMNKMTRTAVSALDNKQNHSAIRDSRCRADH
jgi:hypothetical protein